jgi:hypothetical protein
MTTRERYRGCLECRLTRHGAPHFFRHRCGGRFERHKLGTLWRVRRYSKQPHISKRSCFQCLQTIILQHRSISWSNICESSKKKGTINFLVSSHIACFKCLHGSLLLSHTRTDDHVASSVVIGSRVDMEDTA